MVKSESDTDTNLPEYICWRLFLARQLALLKYKAKNGKNCFQQSVDNDK